MRGRPASDERAIGESAGKLSAQVPPAARAETAGGTASDGADGCGTRRCTATGAGAGRGPWYVASPHPGERWRVEASAIDYTADDGATWERVAKGVIPS